MVIKIIGQHEDFSYDDEYDAHVVARRIFGEVRFVHVTAVGNVQSILRTGLVRSEDGLLGKVIYAYSAEDSYGLEAAERLKWASEQYSEHVYIYGKYTGEYLEVLQGVDNLESCITFDCDVVTVEGYCRSVEEYRAVHAVSW